jgi:hypothetical protein
MSNLSFRHVTIKSLRSNRLLNIASVKDASDVLTLSWPSHGKKKLVAAKKACSDAFDGKISADEVRTAFIAAAKEVDIFIWEKTGHVH